MLKKGMQTHVAENMRRELMQGAMRLRAGSRHKKERRKTSGQTAEKTPGQSSVENEDATDGEESALSLDDIADFFKAFEIE